MPINTFLSTVQINSREQLLSTDINRVGSLGSTQLQNLLKDLERASDVSIMSSLLAQQFASQNPPGPIPGGWPGAAQPVSSTYTVRLTPGQVFVDNGSGVDYDSDASSYGVIRWGLNGADLVLTFGAPDATNPRIDLIVAIPAMATTDLSSRNILLDPVLRTIVAQTVPKTSLPDSVCSVVGGTAAPSPVPPATPTNATVLYEVWVPPLATDATAFKISRAVQRSAVSVASTYHGVLSGCDVVGGSSDGVSDGNFSLSNIHLNRLIVDGELLCFHSGASGGSGDTLWATDATGNPFASPAPSTHDQVFYIYACGGRRLRQGALTLGGVFFEPVCFVMSTVVPDRYGRPSSNITTPRGVTQAGAVWVSCGWTMANTTFKAGMVQSKDTIAATATGSSMGGFQEPAVAGGATYSAVSLTTAPFTGRGLFQCDVMAAAVSAGGAVNMQLNNSSDKPVAHATVPTGTSGLVRAVMPNALWGGIFGSTIAGSISIAVAAYYNIPFPRLGL